jgi:hypothetical protein
MDRFRGVQNNTTNLIVALFKEIKLVAHPIPLPEFDGRSLSILQ